MSDGRWADVDVLARSAVTHFTNAAKLYATFGASSDPLDQYRDRMALMHAMQAAYTSVESALMRILAILDETPPSGEHWHADLLARAGRAMDGNLARPPILGPALVQDLQEARRFRHLVSHDYEHFDLALAAPAVAAADRIGAQLIPAIAAFKSVVDPD